MAELTEFWTVDVAVPVTVTVVVAGGPRAPPTVDVAVTVAVAIEVAVAVWVRVTTVALLVETAVAVLEGLAEGAPPEAAVAGALKVAAGETDPIRSDAAKTEVAAANRIRTAKTTRNLMSVQLG